MIKVEHIDTGGIEHAVRAMRNPMNSWDRSNDEADKRLMHSLYKAGPEHRTYLRMMQVWMDITAPLYWWKEMDRYTVGKSQVSTSTMHKIMAKEFTADDFSYEHLLDTDCCLMKDAYLTEESQMCVLETHPKQLMENYIIPALNTIREKYITAVKVDSITDNAGPDAKTLWWQVIQLLPSSYNQRRTVCMSYETAVKIIRERTGHKLDEWNEFVEILKALPYMDAIREETE